MGLTPKFNQSAIDAVMKQAEEIHTNKIVRVLRFVGEKAVNEAKANGSYRDITANLRNSIGYVIVLNGKVIDENFEASAQGIEPTTENPVRYGKNLAYQIAKRHKQIALIVVSGMKYGLAVEARGRNVLTSAEQLANIEVPRLLSQLK